MTAVIEESTGINLADDALYADDDDEPGEVPGQDAPPASSADAPYGYTLDRETREWRPKKRPGRPKVPASAEELAGQPPVDRPADRAPGRGKSARPPAEEVPMPAGGVIARGVNKLYRRAGKVVRAMDYDIGTAIIECTHKEDEDDLTVGEAWEALCKSNPRIRRFVLSCLKGGAWSDLIMAHAPIAMAIAMKPAILRFLPSRLIESVAEPDDDTPEGEGDLPGGMTAADAAEMEALARDMAAKAAAKMGVRVTDADLDRAARSGVQFAQQRQQPKRQTRAQRSKAGAK